MDSKHNVASASASHQDLIDRTARLNLEQDAALYQNMFEKIKRHYNDKTQASGERLQVYAQELRDGGFNNLPEKLLELFNLLKNEPLKLSLPMVADVIMPMEPFDPSNPDVRHNMRSIEAGLKKFVNAEWFENPSEYAQSVIKKLFEINLRHFRNTGKLFFRNFFIVETQPFHHFVVIVTNNNKLILVDQMNGNLICEFNSQNFAKFAHLGSMHNSSMRLSLLNWPQLVQEFTTNYEMHFPAELGNLLEMQYEKFTLLKQKRVEICAAMEDDVSVRNILIERINSESRLIRSHNEVNNDFRLFSVYRLAAVMSPAILINLRAVSSKIEENMVLPEGFFAKCGLFYSLGVLKGHIDFSNTRVTAHFPSEVDLSRMLKKLTILSGMIQPALTMLCEKMCDRDFSENIDPEVLSRGGVIVRERGDFLVEQRNNNNPQPTVTLVGSVSSTFVAKS